MVLQIENGKFCLTFRTPFNLLTLLKIKKKKIRLNYNSTTMCIAAVTQKHKIDEIVHYTCKLK